MKIENNRAVAIHYRLSDADGIELDTSRGGAPMWYLHGHGNLLVGVERALDGHEAGDRLTAVIAPRDGYGEAAPEAEARFPLSAFPAAFRGELARGVSFIGPDPKQPKRDARLTVISVGNEFVEATTAHPLAGVELHFEFEVVAVRDASAEEIAHRHIHGPGGHHH